MASASICGYINGFQASSITCTTGYCGFNSLYNAAGCCASTVPIPLASRSVVGADSYSLTDCTYTTSCFDSTEVDGSNFNTMDLLCTDPLSPVCAGYTFTDAGYAALFCTDTSTIIEAALTADDVGGGAAASATGGTAAAVASVTDKFPAATTSEMPAVRTSEAGPVMTSEAGTGASETGAGGRNPFPKAQGSVGAVGSATMVRGNGCAGGGRGRVGIVAVIAVVVGVFVGC